MAEEDSVTHTIEKINDSIISAAEASIPQTSSSPRRLPVPWWTEECGVAIKNCKKHIKNFNALRLQKTCYFLKNQKLRRDVLCGKPSESPGKRM